MPDVTINPERGRAPLVSGPVTLVAPDGRLIDTCADPLDLCRLCGQSEQAVLCLHEHSPARPTSTDACELRGQSQSAGSHGKIALRLTQR